MSATKQLLDLPIELQLNILVFLPASTLLTLTSTSSALRSLIQSHPSLLYIIDCYRYGVVDCCESSQDSWVGAQARGETLSNGVVVGEKLKRLREREENWSKLAGEEFIIEMEEDTPIYELQSGLFVRGCDKIDTAESEPEPPPGGRCASLELYQLPTRSNPTPCPKVKLEFELGPYIDLTLDPSQNLIVILVREKLSSLPSSSVPDEYIYKFVFTDMKGQVREDVPVWEHEIPARQPGRMTIQIMNDTLACLISDSDPETEEESEWVLIHDWRKGSTEAVYNVPPCIHYPSLTLLSPTAFLLAAFDLPTQSSTLTTFVVSSDPETTTPIPISNHHLPPITDKAFKSGHVAVDIRPDPPSSSFSSATIDRTETRMFTTDPREGILHVDLMIDLANFHLYIDKRVFLDRLEKGGVGEELESETLMWEDWGPRGSRMMGGDIRMQRQWVTFLNGSRAIFHHRPQWTSTPVPEGTIYPITVLDFNRFTNPPIPPSLSSESPSEEEDTIRYRTVLRPEDPSQEDLMTRLVNPPTSISSSSGGPPSKPLAMRPGPRMSIIEKSNIFLEDVRTMLPYKIGTLFEKEGGTECDGVMMTEESIILTSVSNADDPDNSRWKFRVLAM